jgi:hypothetical protein
VEIDFFTSCLFRLPTAVFTETLSGPVSFPVSVIQVIPAIGSL